MKRLGKLKKFKKIVFVSIFFLIVLGNVKSTAATTSEFKNGDGTIANPYHITNENELYLINQHLDACFILMNDIEITNPLYTSNGSMTSYLPIGYKEKNAFTGVFNGNGHVIKGINNTCFMGNFDADNRNILYRSLWL